ncbi:MAG: sigma-54-dependent Fis family transcriptional regulator [Nevskia sp.]|nr:sigma-54-dependent Fis family transcriptional regulator [Nevskia sp.]
MFATQPVTHSEMIEGLTRGRWDRTRIDPRIARSWSRSAGQSLDPCRPESPQVLPEFRLREHRAPLEPLLQLARDAVDALFRQVRDAGYVVLLSNPAGVTVEFRNNESLDRELRKAGLYLGGCWPEGVEGTNAIGMCAVDKTPITVHRAEHFRKPNATLTCSAAPLRSETGELMAVLDASALYSPDDKRSQLLVLQLVSVWARLIENAYFSQRFEQQWVVRTGHSRQFLEVATEGLIALDDHGRILAANAQLCEQLGEEQAHIAGRGVEEVLGLRFGGIADAASKSVPLHWKGPAGEGFGLVRRPRRPVPRASARPAAARELAALAGGDPQMRACVERARRVVDKGIPLLLHGETGSGKEFFAHAFHQASARVAAPFIALNCAAIPEALIESELFGYSNGAFTGARAKGSRGKIAQADGGTLFLDEIGDMPLGLQTRLLRVLSEREVTPLGTEKPVPVDLQLICATHRDLMQLVQAGTFRQDLYFRLNGITLNLPPLRQRSDKGALIDQLLAEEAKSLGRDSYALQEDARLLLLRYAWPGNLRELRSTLRSALALSDSGAIEVAHLRLEMREAAARLGPPGSSVMPEQDDSAGGAAGAAADELLLALRRCHWNITRTARLLRISRATVYRRMAREGIVQPNHRD